MSSVKHAAEEALMVVTPIDGRYRARTVALQNYFSEFALIRYRVRVEIEWYLSLAASSAFTALAPLPAASIAKLRAIYADFSLADAERVKAIEAETNHDVKAVEYFVEEKSPRLIRTARSRFVHFACTSRGHQQSRLRADAARCARACPDRPSSKNSRGVCRARARHAALPMLARTHGQRSLADHARQGDRDCSSRGCARQRAQLAAGISGQV